MEISITFLLFFFEPFPKQFTLFSMETGVKKVDIVMAINLSSVALILTKDFFQALERPRVI